MPRRCTVCDHAERTEIDQALVRGATLWEIAGNFGISKSAVHRHAEAHIPEALKLAQRASEAAHGDALLGQVLDLRDRALGVLTKAEGAEDHRTALAAIREARATVELLAKLVGELDERPVINVATFYASPEWGQIQALVMAVMEPYPEARQELAQGLTLIEAERA